MGKWMRAPGGGLPRLVRGEAMQRQLAAQGWSECPAPDAKPKKEERGRYYYTPRTNMNGW